MSTKQGFAIGELPKGARNAITDVEGVHVGHVTLADGHIQTGVTAIRIGNENPFHVRARAAVQVFNGFGKSAGLMQIEELGELETPILLTNTLSVGAVTEGVVEYMCAKTQEIGREAGTVNACVFECNDGFINDIRGFHVRPHHVWEALANAGPEFKQGAVGAGRGMSAFGLKGGIGSASRIVKVGKRDYTLGVMVLSNMGRLPDFIMAGKEMGDKLQPLVEEREHGPEKGSIIMIVGTDLPLSERQLKRVARRTSVGLARTGSFLGHGSGDIALAFTTSDPVRTQSRARTMTVEQIDERRIDRVFRATAEATEEAILNSMLYAETVSGRNNHTRYALSELLSSLEGK
ncbi:S58 family peptidase [Rhodobacteraceae bacterium RKSG542]|uniref:DmpA family aminopeptidase n=1 Tax=Pseudovibrio flavus TaxID=2529854 RepID=UPI0012BBB8FC|nr:P1 family peptidase [Pseudovibrio flavus]MTI16039.1 S58 family peptidase [Pseudovibrio flavus]